MRQCTLGLVGLASVAVLAAVAVADTRNAATWYQRGIDRLLRLSESDLDIMQSYVDPGSPPSPAVREALSRAGPVIDLVRRGARQEYSDFGLEYERGLEMILPHLAHLRQISRILRTDAFVRLHDGDSAAAADRVATMYRVAEHAGHDGVIISSLVGGAIFDWADKTAQIGFDRVAFNPHDCEVMLKAATQLDARDPFRIAEATVGEQEWAIPWLAVTLGDAEERAQLAEKYVWLVDGDQGGAELAAMSDEEFEDALDGYDRLMDRVVTAFAMEDAEAGKAELERIDQELETGAHGVIASATIPSLLRLHAKLIESRERVTARIDVLSRLATGEAELEEEANAALYYVRAISMLRSIEPAQQAVLCPVALPGDEEPAEDAAKTPASANDIIDVIREGSTRRRCDFRVLRLEMPSAVCPAELAGMTDLFRLLAADAHRLLVGGDTGAAADRLAIGFRVIAHLSRDEPIPSAVIAHDAYRRLLEVTGLASQRPEFADAHRAIILDAVERIERKDPFGYLESILAARTFIARRLRTMAPPQDETDEEATIRRIVHRWPTDRLLYAMIVLETTRRSDDGDGGPPPTRPAAPIGGWSGVLDPDEMDAARREAPAVVSLFEQGLFDEPFSGRTVPKIVPVTERMRTARRDLRHGHGLLRKTDDASERSEDDAAADDKERGGS